MLKYTKQCYLLEFCGWYSGISFTVYMLQAPSLWERGGQIPIPNICWLHALGKPSHGKVGR